MYVIAIRDFIQKLTLAELPNKKERIFKGPVWRYRHHRLQEAFALTGTGKSALRPNARPGYDVDTPLQQPRKLLGHAMSKQASPRTPFRLRGPPSNNGPRTALGPF
ncbi:hypothetical protein Taro_033666 [Colocasia esculenta]|uniref:Uncharacterized protein n=1 Tax=Colocasia esculenta TaxID=4460 RepID=A0A843VPC0_COLES|nr:hypothetical protein [Colocasia esculenta]